MTFVVLATFAGMVISVKTTHNSLSLDDSGDRPITKVVNMLKGMAEESDADAAAEAAVYEKFECYCTKTIDAKTKSIETLTDNIAMTKIKIEKNVALASQLAEKKAELKKDLSENDASQTAANSSREKANEEFKSEESDMVNGLTQLSQAYDTLAAVGSPEATQEALLQLSNNPALVTLTKQLQDAAHSQKFLSRSPGNYEDQSGGVLGVLRSTRDTYAKNLEDLRAAEAANVEAYNKLTKSLLNSEAELEAMKRNTESAQADTASLLATLRSSLKDDEDTLATDTEIKTATEKMYAEKTAIMEERKMLRSQEDTAMAQAIAVLNSDSSFDAFGKTDTTKTKASFLQVSQSSDVFKKHRAEVLSFLRAEVRKTHSSRLAHLAAFATAAPEIYKSDRPMNPFQPVLNEIDSMQGVIHEEEKADQKKFDWCDVERTSNHADNASRTEQIITLTASITSLAQVAEQTEGELQQAKYELDSNTEDQTTMTSDRSEENQAYQQNIANLQNAAMLMQKAIKILTTYYDKLHPKEALLQEEPEAEEPPKYEFSAKFQGQKGKGGTGVIGELETILETTKTEESDAHKAEQQAQAEFEDEMKSLTDGEAAGKKTIASLTKEIAETRLEMDQKKDERKDANAEKASILKYLEEITPGCVFIELNFEQRQANRVAESESLTKAIDLIKGTPAYTNFEEKEAAAR